MKAVKFEDLRLGMWLTQIREDEYTFKPHTSQIVEVKKDWVATKDYNGFSGGNETSTMENFRIATRQEIKQALIEFADRGLSILPTVYHDRIIEASDYIKGYNLVCHAWQAKLKDWFAESIVLHGHAVVSDDQYKEMVNEANDKQLKLIEEVLGLEVEEEVIYCMGDRFTNTRNNDEYILAQPETRMCCLICLRTGNRYTEPVRVISSTSITEDELKSMSGITYKELVRTYENTFYK